MHSSFDIWKLLAGVAIFLLGMSFLESSLRQLAGRKFKLFLRRQTQNRFKAIAGGAVVTGVLQSSSVVNLMVLAFVGANIITMQNALALILGANLGTTLDSWIVATVGFKLNIEAIAFPITAIAGISLAISRKDSAISNWSHFLLGLGFLFIGLDFMKTGIESVVNSFDLGTFSHSPLAWFLLIGFLVTALIQSSLATVAITLSALHANVISFPQATAIVLGSEVGTTVKLIIASVKGNAVKKRVALGNFLFNFVTAVLVFVFIGQVNHLVKDVIRIHDNLFALVFFQSFVNIVSIIVFLPFLNLLRKFLEKRFRHTNTGMLFIQKMPVADTDLAIEAMNREAGHFATVVINFCMECFGLEKQIANGVKLHRTIQETYDHIKYMHGEIHAYYIQLQKTVGEKKDIEEIDSLISCVRNCMYAAKSSRDAYNDALQLKNSSNDVKYQFYLQTTGTMDRFCSELLDILAGRDARMYFDKLTAVYRSVTKDYTLTLEQLYKESVTREVSEVEITTLINFNRETFTCYKSLAFALKDYLLDKKEAAYFDDLPGFIR